MRQAHDNVLLATAAAVGQAGEELIAASADALSSGLQLVGLPELAAAQRGALHKEDALILAVLLVLALTLLLRAVRRRRAAAARA